MITLPETVVQFMDVFKKNNHQIFVVGGPVRDLMLGKDVKNWDFATNATPEQVQKLFPESFYHNTYGTVTVMINEVPYEVTPFRKEGTYSDNRHPDKLEWAKTIEEDVARRDFTINAMAFDGSQLLDLFEGQRDLKEKLVVAVGDPDKRFQEDALRLLRAVRFSAQLGFEIEQKTKDSIKKNAELIQTISWERVRD
jgi:tRNA nucleotidyltransferase/poly(A) polymerase